MPYISRCPNFLLEVEPFLFLSPGAGGRAQQSGAAWFPKAETRTPAGNLTLGKMDERGGFPKI